MISKCSPGKGREGSRAADEGDGSRGRGGQGGQGQGEPDDYDDDHGGESNDEEGQPE